ncbi:flavodoxin-dependent (E)-4-hydroxy-3-methylbut-2-enyl-diphosphate synthase [Thermodesulfovibrionales bacterium]|nr:flavodoxin-dependent (E)-4-hydroxy-3-methylbut-2-enyl-diphosphate synthase [Thermodesulfovibrionales bacterium]MCL0033563.1 flavodoxin-dependent (E)-4-hydroxy-3-methylbut-2-enyl-diphosphate synthase [Thermodesulfovibrionales bacterium]MCL0042333.1 flavodoxin-dependent (E)-4-hydroxy-3-methylbut-2-enyl-diphosphate synthase [Thermodesulfovibrionales bacterium]MCL0066710.1 flavodoxin-dependent (E)-4-hydroxy-3-methylbut-2-enyl-diphosphate synthase [Thermodesulfovibrionales bacterium]MCL0083496.1 
MIISRKKTRQLYVGNAVIGGGHPISVQSMTKTDTRDVDATAQQVASLESAGCEIIRIAVPDMDAAYALGLIKRSVNIPVVADIHFDWRLAMAAMRQGVDGLRLNPGNIGAKWKVKEIAILASELNIPIRIGVNAGSLEKELLQKYRHSTPEALVESAEGHIKILEELDFHDIEVSLKASNVMKTIDAYRLFSEKYDYPLHIGISEAGPPSSGVIKSAVGLGILLSEGIGDTVRVSLTAPPEEEVKVAYEILKSLRLRQRGPEIISCPTCGRCKIDLSPIVKRVEEAIKVITKPISIAVMGCVVNGPGEAREADFGIAGGNGRGLVFKKGEVVRSVEEDELVESLMEVISKE